MTPINSPSSFTETEKVAWLDMSAATQHADFAAELKSRNRRSTTELLSPLSRVTTMLGKAEIPNEVRAYLPKAINVPPATQFSMKSLHFCCLTIGSRGDVQPYIALGKVCKGYLDHSFTNICVVQGLIARGHRVTIVTHEEYKVWVEGFGVGHRSAGGDPGALMKLSVENKVRCTDFSIVLSA